MAGGKTPRDRMINLMYLVFISMMAMNMGKEVLAAFGTMNLKFQESNSDMITANNAAYEALVIKGNENETFKEAAEHAKKVKELSDDFYNYIEKVKTDIMSQTEDKTDYQVMDKGDFLDEKWFAPDGLKPEGKKFYDYYINYPKQIIALIGDNPNLKALIPEIEKRFSSGVNGKVKNREGEMVPWLNYKFEGFPYIASVAYLSLIQSDIRKTEQEFYTEFVGAGMKKQASYSNYTTLLEQTKGAYYSGQVFDGAVVLGRKDNSTKPARVELSVDGRRLGASEYEILDGKVKLKVNAGNVGDHKITGNLFYEQDGTETPVPVEQTFTTIPRPNEAVISADKMNVVYVGVDNPMTISMPGVSDNLLSASAPGLRKKSGSSYVMRPAKAGGEVTISVTGTIEGDKFSSSKRFRVKPLPKAQGAIFKQVGEAAFPKSNVAAGQISVIYENFDFDLKANVTSFVVSVEGERIKVNGNRISAEPRAVAAINRCRKGSTVQITEIKYKVEGYNGFNPSASPIAITITQ